MNEDRTDIALKANDILSSARFQVLRQYSELATEPEQLFDVTITGTAEVWHTFRVKAINAGAANTKAQAMALRLPDSDWEVGEVFDSFDLGNITPLKPAAWVGHADHHEPDPECHLCQQNRLTNAEVNAAVESDRSMHTGERE